MEDEKGKDFDQLNEQELIDLMNGPKNNSRPGVMDLGINENTKGPAARNEKPQEEWDENDWQKFMNDGNTTNYHSHNLE